MMHHLFRSTAIALACAAVVASLGGCAVGPNYVRPSAPLSPTYKEAAGWSPAAPADTLDRGDWWSLFNDPILSGLAIQPTGQERLSYNSLWNTPFILGGLMLLLSADWILRKQRNLA